MVRVAIKSYRERGIEKAFQGLRGSEHIFIFILESAVDENNPFGLHRTLRKQCNPFEILRLELRSGPVNRHFGHWIEIVGGHNSSDCFVVVSADGGSAEFANE